MMMMGENRVTAMQEQVEDRVVQETDRLAWRIVMEEAQEVEQISQAEICLRHCVGKMLERHSMVFGGMMAHSRHWSSNSQRVPVMLYWRLLY